VRGTFDIKLKWAEVTYDCDSTPESAAFMFTALREQLGFSLDASRGLIDVMTIDSAEVPTAD
jgi:uncharacterized protein (TIGR03435 family)